MMIMTKTAKKLTRYEYLESILTRYDRNSHSNGPFVLKQNEEGIKTRIQDNGEFILSKKYRAPLMISSLIFHVMSWY